MDAWEGSQLHQAKEILAYELTKLVHGEAEADKAQEAARALFGGSGSSENMPATQLPEARFTDGKIGAIELLNHLPTGKTYHQYINPERSMPRRESLGAAPSSPSNGLPNLSVQQ